MTTEVWETVIGVNLTGAWHTTKAVAPHMIARRSGSLVYTVSTNGWHGGYNYSAYTASKHGVAGLMKCAALELGRHGIRANALLPGAVNSPMMVNAYSKEFVTGSADASDERLDHQVRHNTVLPGRRMLPPSAVADAALWLASDESQHVTGAEITVDAGHTRLPQLQLGPPRRPGLTATQRAPGSAARPVGGVGQRVGGQLPGGPPQRSGPVDQRGPVIVGQVAERAADLQ